MSQVHFNVLGRGTEILCRRISFGLGASYDFEFEGLAGRQIDDRFIRGLASFTNLVEMVTRSGARFSHLIIDLELMSFRRQQFLARVGVGGDVLGRCQTA